MSKLLWPLLLALLSQAHAENILGKTTPFSKSQACQQVKCKLLSETKVGPYVVYTYRGRTANPFEGEVPETVGRYFAIKRDERNVALGVYYRNAGGAGTEYDTGFELIEAPRIAKLLGFTAPDMKPYSRKNEYGQATIQSKPFALPLSSKVLLTNKSTLPVNAYGEGSAYLSVVYAVTKAEAEAVGKLLNRPDTATKNRLVAQIKKDLGAYGGCNYTDKNGKPFKMTGSTYNYLDKWVTEAETRGMVWARAVGFPVLTMPGLSSTTLELVYNNGYPTPWPEVGNIVCLR